jgi:signal peptidase II
VILALRCSHWHRRAKVAAASLIDRPVDLGIVSLRVVRNSGVAFGLGAGAPPWLLVGATVVVAVVLIVALIRDGLPNNLAGGLVIAGAVANIGDRVLDGSVVDVIDLGWWAPTSTWRTYGSSWE